MVKTNLNELNSTITLKMFSAIFLSLLPNVIGSKQDNSLKTGGQAKHIYINLEVTIQACVL